MGWADFETARPSDVRKASGFPVLGLVSSEAMPRDSFGGVASKIEYADSERQSLSAHQAAKPQTKCAHGKKTGATQC